MAALYLTVVYIFSHEWTRINTNYKEEIMGIRNNVEGPSGTIPIVTQFVANK